MQLFGLNIGGLSDGESRKKEFDAKAPNIDWIANYYIDNRNNFGQFNDWQLNEFVELYAHKAPQQGHGWTDRTSEISTETANKFNNIVYSHQGNSDWSSYQTLLLDISKTRPKSSMGITNVGTGNININNNPNSGGKDYSDTVLGWLGLGSGNSSSSNEANSNGNQQPTKKSSSTWLIVTGILALGTLVTVIIIANKKK